MSGYHLERASAETFATFSNAISDAIHAALKAGLDSEEVASVLVSVAADYMRITHGPDSLRGLADVILLRADLPMPDQLQ